MVRAALVARALDPDGDLDTDHYGVDAVVLTTDQRCHAWPDVGYENARRRPTLRELLGGLQPPNLTPK